MISYLIDSMCMCLFVLFDVHLLICVLYVYIHMYIL